MASHNSTPGINNQSRQPGPNYNVPPELAIFILNLRFPEIHDEEPTRKDMAALYDLRLVSRLWKELIEDTPTLWTCVSVDFPTTVIRDCLWWSKSHSLRIWIYYPSTKCSHTLIKHHNLLQSQSHRWKTLSYHTGDQLYIDYQHVKSFLESPAPILQSIDTNLKAFKPEPIVNLAGGQAKALKHLSLSDVLLPWSSSLLHGLETFSLWIHNPIPVKEVINLLIKSPALKSLELSSGDAEGLDDPTPLTTSTLDLVATSLEEVIIYVASPHIISHVLSRVSMPSCKTLEFSTTITTLGDLDTLGNALVQFMPRIAEVLRRGGRTSLLVESDLAHEWSSSLEYDAFRFCFGFSNILVERVIGWIRNLIATLEYQLELEIFLDTSDRQTIEALGKWNDIAKLEVYHGAVSSTHGTDEDILLLDFLGDVRVDSVDGLSWPFPNLHELDVYHAGCDHLAVFGMLNRRYLPEIDVRVLEEQGISVRTPPKVNLRVKGTDGDSTVMTMLKHHWGVKSLTQEELDE
ncbi:hypothetical protein FRC04_011354 [Tulasnella sp. 424]|nr:hypothetical protein FRC04_011354 [Tulasnella sp. 424]KAG8975477.1 hypothetical protein FRC05_005546 [Tulasnella sp. 425]